jgi:hypothetical protein
MLMVFDSSNGGRFALESLHCGGTFALKESDDNTFFYSYNLEYGTGCELGVTAKIEVRSENHLQLTAFRRTGEPFSFGTLQRTDK